MVLAIWRRGWDLNPRYPLRYVRFRGGSFQPLTHLSASDQSRTAAHMHFIRSKNLRSGLCPSKPLAMRIISKMKKNRSGDIDARDRRPRKADVQPRVGSFCTTRALVILQYKSTDSYNCFFSTYSPGVWAT